MKVLVLGTGLQGRATLHDLSRSPEVTHVIAADSSVERLAPLMPHLDSSKVELVAVDASDPAAVSALMRQVDAVVSLLPITLHVATARLAVENGIHYVNTSYTPPEFRQIGEEAAARNLTILPECGFDPGIDLVLAGQAMRDLDVVEEYYSYGTGFPEPQAANNPLRYKISWTFAGVLKAYHRDAVVVRNGKNVKIAGREMFAPGNIHLIDLEGYGAMEAYPNGDVVDFLDRMGITATVKNAARYATRWPGHCAFWYTMAQLGFLEDQPIKVGEASVVPRDFVCSLLEPQLQYADDERDVAVLRVDVRGLKAGERRRVVYELVDVRDLETGLMAMNRTVGYTASIGVQMVLRGDITKRGLLSALTDIPADRLITELQARGITVRRLEEAC